MRRKLLLLLTAIMAVCGVGWAQSAATDPTITTDLSVVQKGEEIVFGVTTTPGNVSKETKVKVKLGFEDVTKENIDKWELKYYETDPKYVGWMDWDESSEGYLFGPSDGFSLQNATSYFSIKPTDEGTYTFKLAIINFNTGEVIGEEHSFTLVVEDGVSHIAIADVNFASIYTAIEKAESGNTIIIPAGNYKFDRQIVIEKSLTIKGQGEVILSDSSTFAPIDTEVSRNLIKISNVTDGVTLKDLTITNSKGNAMVIYKSGTTSGKPVTLSNIQLLNNKQAGAVIDGSIVIANGLVALNNEWGGVNLENKAGVVPSLTLDTHCQLEGPWQVWADYGGVDNWMTTTGWTALQVRVINQNSSTAKTLWTNNVTTGSGNKNCYHVSTPLEFQKILKIVNQTDILPVDTLRLKDNLDLTNVSKMIAQGSEAQFEYVFNLQKNIIIDGNGNTISGEVNIDGKNKSYIFTLDGTSAGATLKNLTIQNTNATAINVYGQDDVELKNITLKNNTGGGLNINSAKVTAENLTTEGNSYVAVRLQKQTEKDPLFTLVRGKLSETVKIAYHDRVAAGESGHAVTDIQSIVSFNGDANWIPTYQNAKLKLSVPAKVVNSWTTDFDIKSLSNKRFAKLDDESSTIQYLVKPLGDGFIFDGDTTMLVQLINTKASPIGTVIVKKGENQVSEYGFIIACTNAYIGTTPEVVANIIPTDGKVISYLIKGTDNKYSIKGKTVAKDENALKEAIQNSTEVVLKPTDEEGESTNEMQLTAPIEITKTVSIIAEEPLVIKVPEGKPAFTVSANVRLSLKGISIKTISTSTTSLSTKATVEDKKTAIYNDGTTVLEDCSFVDINKLNTTYPGDAIATKGAAIYNTGTFIMIGGKIENCKADVAGAVYNAEDASATFQKVTFKGNEARQAAAIIAHGNLTLEDCIFDGNYLSTGNSRTNTAGLIYADDKSTGITMQRCEVKNNIGGISIIHIHASDVEDRKVNIYNSLFFNNGNQKLITAEASNDKTTILLINNTFVNNSDAGVACIDVLGGRFNLINNILWTKATEAVTGNANSISFISNALKTVQTLNNTNLVLTSKPVFSSTSLTDFHLDESAAVDKSIIQKGGDAAVAIGDKDLEGKARFTADGKIIIGAYQTYKAAGNTDDPGLAPSVEAPKVSDRKDANAKIEWVKVTNATTYQLRVYTGSDKSTMVGNVYEVTNPTTSVSFNISSLEKGKAYYGVATAYKGDGTIIVRKEFDITKENTTGIEEIFAGSRVYTSGKNLCIEPSQDVKVTVIGMDGKILFNEAISQKVIVPIANSGIYAVTFNDGKNQATQKVAVF